jgi:uracil DNA glycosylase
VLIAADEPIVTSDANGFGFAGVFDLDFEFMARQGILFVNRVFTTRMANPGSHKDFGWQDFYESIRKLLLSRHIAYGMPPVMVIDYSHTKLSSNHVGLPAHLDEIKKLANEFVKQHYNDTIEWN